MDLRGLGQRQVEASRERSQAPAPSPAPQGGVASDPFHTQPIVFPCKSAPKKLSGSAPPMICAIPLRCFDLRGGAGIFGTWAESH